MRSFSRLVVLVASLCPIAGLAQPAGSDDVVESFKVGTFEADQRRFVGVVLRDRFIVDIGAATDLYSRAAGLPELSVGSDMLEFIAGYDTNRRRIYAVVNDLVEGAEANAGAWPAYVHDLAEVRTRAPIMYPSKILNAAVNFYTHVNETGTPEEIEEARRQRRVNRGVPYLFLKPGRGAVIGNGDAIVIPWGRDRIDWEVELGTVIGTTAKYVSADAAQDYVFGYMVTLDISDRGGRPPGGAPFQTDWFVGKGHDTFAPQGPWIVPKEFYGDPMENLRQTLSVDGEQMQEARAGDMIHSLYELIEYASSIITLYPGDVINNGTSGGVGMGTAVRGEQRFLRPGEEVVATIDGIGTLRMPVVAGPRPSDGTGARLPPVSSYSQ